jgi:hypothetical protein
MATIVIPIDQLEAKFLQACLIIQQLRKYEEIWFVDYGGVNRRNLARWQHRADIFMNRLTIDIDDNEKLNKTKLIDGNNELPIQQGT